MVLSHARLPIPPRELKSLIGIGLLYQHACVTIFLAVNALLAYSFI